MLQEVGWTKWTKMACANMAEWAFAGDCRRPCYATMICWRRCRSWTLRRSLYVFVASGSAKTLRVFNTGMTKFRRFQGRFAISLLSKTSKIRNPECPKIHRSLLVFIGKCGGKMRSVELVTQGGYGHVTWSLGDEEDKLVDRVWAEGLVASIGWSPFFLGLGVSGAQTQTAASPRSVVSHSFLKFHLAVFEWIAYFHSVFIDRLVVGDGSSTGLGIKGFEAFGRGTLAASCVFIDGTAHTTVLGGVYIWYHPFTLAFPDTILNHPNLPFWTGALSEVEGWWA